MICEPCHPRSSRRAFYVRGFTLIELLVVIAIVGMLLAILLPAVQQARESARRTSCKNNLKQLGLALHNYHDAFQKFPIGANYNRGTGLAWTVGLLPYLDQGQLFNQFDMISANNGAPTVPAGAQNASLCNRVRIPSLTCPSTTILPILQSVSLGAYFFQQASYIGISGATNLDSFPASRVKACCQNRDGQISADGLLVPNTAISMGNVTDGLTNVLILGECSDYAYDAAGGRHRIDGSYPNAWYTGAWAVGVPPDYVSPLIAMLPSAPASNSSNITTINYTPNSTYVAGSTTVPGMRENGAGAMNPLTSPHTGGVHGVLADGSVRFLSDSINLFTLKALACRDDGQLVAEF